MKSYPLSIVIPLLNPNEPEAMLAAVHITEGQHVSEGDLLCTLETTKSTAEVFAPAAGYVAGLRFTQGQIVHAGEILCYLGEAPGWRPAEVEAPAALDIPPGPVVPDGLRITQPALALARQNHLDLNQLPAGSLVTESVVRAYLHKTANHSASAPDFSPPESPFDPAAIIVYGGGGHGKMVIDLLRSQGSYRIQGVIDDGVNAGKMILGVPVVGNGEMLPELYSEGVRMAVNAVAGIGNLAPRVQVFQRLAEAGFACPPVVHPMAYLEPSAGLAPGVQVFARAYVGSQARLGFGNIINTGAIISHDCVFGEYVNISPGAILAGEVQVGAGALVGMGVTINLQVKIGAGARIGNGATIKSDVPDNGIVRAGAIWPA